MKKLIAILCIVILGFTSSSQTSFDKIETKKKVTIIRVRDEVGKVILQTEV